MLFEEMLKGVNLEDYEVEFKGIIKEGPSNDCSGREEIKWLKVIAAFANTFGGTLYVGVEDKTHQVVALSHEECDKIALMVQRLIAIHIEPPVKYKIDKLVVPDTNPTRYVLAIKVEKSKYPPVSLHTNSASVIYVRHFGKTSAATGEEIRALVMNSESVSYDILESETQFDPNDFKKLYAFYAKQNDGKELTEKDLLNIGFFTLEGRLKNGALLFKDDCSDLKTLVECSHFPGVSKGENVFLSTKRISGNLIDEYEEIMDFVSTRSINGFIKTETGRDDLISYPRRSLAEGVVNALGHRNYFISGSQIEINIYKDRLEITSPGSLTSKKWLRNEKNLSSIPPIRRNELICSVFSLCKLMDKKGSGFDKIEDEYKRFGPSYAPFVSCDDSYFSLTLPDLAHQGGLIANNDKPGVSVRGEKLNDKFLDVLSLCYNKACSAYEIAESLGIKPSTYFRKEIIGPLLTKNLLLANNEYPVKYQSNHDLVIPD